MGSTSKDELLRTDFLKLGDSSGKITKVISPNPFQVGLDHDDFRSQLTIKGPVVAEQGVTVADGADLIQAGSNISVTKNSNGSLTIAASAFTTQALTATVAGGLAFDSGTTYDGSSAKTLSIDLYGNQGLSIDATYGLRVDITAASSVTPTTSDTVLFGDATDSYLTKRTTIGDILALGSAGTLANAITIGAGIKDTGGATSYNNTAAITLAAEAESSKGLGVTSSGIKIDPSTLSSATVATGDKVLIGDIDDSDNVKYVTAQSIANLATVGTLTSALTIGNGVQLNSGTTFDGSQARTLTAKDDGTTTSVGASGISVLKVPKSLTHGDGIQTLSYDGSTAKTVAIDRNTSGGLNFDNARKIQADINNLPAGPIPTTSDEVAVSFGANNTQKIDIATLGAVATSHIISSTVWVDGGLKAKTTSSISIDSDNRYADGVGMADAFVFISGSTGSRGTTTRGTTVFGGDVYVSGSTYAPTLSGSLTRLSDGTSYLKAGSNVTITSESNGSITIASTGGAGGGSITFSSGSTSVASVSAVDTSRLGTIQNLGGGSIAITGSIGIAEDGSYIDGLFTDFNPNTPVGTAVDRFNEVLKGLAPSAAPSLDDMDSNNTGAGAKLSFGSSQSITGYTNAQPSTLSSPASNLSDVDINGTYSSATTSNDIRSACFAGSTTIEGTLNEDISADGSNYPANSFGNGDQGTLTLYINDNSSAAHAVDLSAFSSGDSLNGNGSGFFSLSAADSGHFSDGSSFDTFKHRTGSFRVSTTDQRNGWNYARVIHTVGSSITTTNYVEWVNDPDANALTSAGSDFDSLSMTGIKKLSGARYNTGGTAQYRIRVENAYRNIYPTSNITFSATNCSVPAQSFPAIDYAGGENETKILHITGSATITADPILNGTISVSTNVPAVLKSSLSSAGSTSINGILLYDLSNTSTVTSETFRAENYRLISGSYNSQSDVTLAGNAWDSSLHMSGTNTGHQDGLLFYNSRLYAPDQGGVSGDFRNTADGGSITQGPSNNVNYSGITSGKRTFYRYFQNNSGGSKSNFSLTINGSGTIASQPTSLNATNLHVLLKIPTTTSGFTTGWMDLALPFSTGQNQNGAGCLDGTLDSSLNATNGGTFGTQSVGAGEYIMVKIEAEANWTGYISNMSITWT